MADTLNTLVRTTSENVRRSWPLLRSRVKLFNVGRIRSAVCSAKSIDEFGAMKEFAMGAVSSTNPPAAVRTVVFNVCPSGGN